MAFIVDQNAPQQGTNQAGIQSAPVSSGGAGVGGPTKAAATPGVNVPAQPSAQLSAYLQANQPQSSNLAGQIAGNLSGNINAVQNAITPAVDIYTGQLNNVQDNPNLDALVSASPSQATAPIPAMPGPNNTEIPAQANPDIAAFQDELNASANAPSSTAIFETTQPYANLTSQIQNDVEQANLWGQGNNPASLSTALTPYEGNAATSGDITLDSLLLSQNPEAYSQIQSAIAPTGNLQGQLNTGAATADQSLQSAIANDQASTAAAQGAGQTYATNLANYLSEQVSANQGAENAGTSANQQIANDATSGNLTAADAQSLGIPAAQATDFATAYDQLNPAITAENTLAGSPTRALYGTNQDLPTLNLAQYLTQAGSGPTITAANVATPQNYSDIAAIQQLFGSDAPTLPISSATANQASLGNTALPTNSYDLTGLSGAAAPELAAAQSLESQLLQGANLDPAQTPGQQDVINEGNAGIVSIINYLNSLLGVPANQLLPIGGNNPTVPLPTKNGQGTYNPITALV